MSKKWGTINMKHIYITIFFLIVFLCGCERDANVSESYEYKQNYISFSIPGNWKITEDEEEDGYRYVFVDSPDSAIFIVSIWPIEEFSPLNEYVELDIERVRDEMPFGSRDHGSVLEFELNHEGIESTGYENRFNITFLKEVVPYIAKYYIVKKESKVAYLSSQAAIEDINKVSEGFDLLLSTFKFK